MTEFIQLRRKTHYHKIIEIDFFICIFLFPLNLALYFELFFATYSKGWWNLKKTLQGQLESYPKHHDTLMRKSQNDMHVRRRLAILWEDYERVDHRFEEMEEVFGAQCTDFSPRITGFNQCICYLFFEWTRPILLAVILVCI